MIRKLIVFCAAFALAGSPSFATGWYPGFSGGTASQSSTANTNFTNSVNSGIVAAAVSN